MMGSAALFLWLICLSHFASVQCLDAEEGVPSPDKSLSHLTYRQVQSWEKACSTNATVVTKGESVKMLLLIRGRRPPTNLAHRDDGDDTPTLIEIVKHVNQTRQFPAFMLRVGSASVKIHNSLGVPLNFDRVPNIALVTCSTRENGHLHLKYYGAENNKAVSLTDLVLWIQNERTATPKKRKSFKEHSAQAVPFVFILLPAGGIVLIRLCMQFPWMKPWVRVTSTTLAASYASAVTRQTGYLQTMRARGVSSAVAYLLRMCGMVVVVQLIIVSFSGVGRALVEPSYYKSHFVNLVAQRRADAGRGSDQFFLEGLDVQSVTEAVVMTSLLFGIGLCLVVLGHVPSQVISPSNSLIRFALLALVMPTLLVLTFVYYGAFVHKLPSYLVGLGIMMQEEAVMRAIFPG
eukprot:PhM_4_TR15864/c0_g1_i1/m.28032